MSCNSRSQIVILSGKCLGNQIIELPCKSPIEAIFYSFSIVNRMKSTDCITYVIGQPSDPEIIVDEICFTGQTFKCRISGGTLNTRTGIRFVIKTKENEVIEFVCVIPVMPEGIISQDAVEKIVLGNTGPAGTITIGKVSTVSSDQQATVTNVGMPSAAILNIDIPQGITPTILTGETVTLLAGEDAKVTATTSGTTTTLNFDIPQGLKGDDGSRWYSGISEPDETTGIQDERGLPRPGDMYLLLNNDGHNASTYILTNDNKWEGPLASVAGPQGAPGINGITPTISIGKIETLASDSQATAAIIPEGNGHNILNLGLVKGTSGVTPTIQVGKVNTIEADQPANVSATTNEAATTFDFFIPKGKQGESYINDGSIDLKVKTISSNKGQISTDNYGNFNAANGYFKILSNASVVARCLELGGNGMQAGYIDFHTTNLNEDGQANDFDARIMVDNTPGLTTSGMGRIRIFGDVTASRSLDVNDSLKIGNQLTVGKIFQSQGFSQFDQNTICTDGKGKITFQDNTNNKPIVNISYKEGINVKEGASLTFSNITSDGTEKSARLRYTGTPTENIISIDSADAQGATIACNRVKTNRLISTYNDNTYTRLCPVIYDASLIIGSENGLPNSVTTGYVVACKNFTVNGNIIKDTMLVRANKDYPTTLAGWDIIGSPTNYISVDNLKSGSVDLNVKSFISDGGKIKSDGQGNITCGLINTKTIAMQCIEVGNGKNPAYIDFHNNNNVTNDYDARFIVGGSSPENGKGILSVYCSQFSIDNALSSDKGKVKTDGQGNLKATTIITQLPLTTDIIIADLKPRMQAWHPVNNIPCYWNGKNWIDAIGNILT